MLEQMKSQYEFEKLPVNSKERLKIEKLQKKQAQQELKKKEKEEKERLKARKKLSKEDLAELERKEKEEARNNRRQGTSFVSRESEAAEKAKLKRDGEVEVIKMVERLKQMERDKINKEEIDSLKKSIEAKKASVSRLL
eukprot:TRINITY_DN3450_c0_g1_i3.p1 TRINITY_DN3450_c0_g1~~TRINITY_DN3450_c0_g1_i3.p1  ORF type:complete len:139 (-),score=51.47 TRINITY_DN3450_c0_g1_i3:54-470(-)